MLNTLLFILDIDHQHYARYHRILITSSRMQDVFLHNTPSCTHIIENKEYTTTNKVFTPPIIRILLIILVDLTEPTVYLLFLHHPFYIKL